MTLKKRTLLLLSSLLFVLTPVHAEIDGKLQILLLGDSTCEASIPKKHTPQGTWHEDIVRLKLAEEKDLPPTNVINKGQSGEYIQRLLDKRYDKEIAKLHDMDYILVRYGINDAAHRENFPENFPKDFHALIARLHHDFPKAQIILMTVIPFSNPETSEKINTLVKQVATEEKLPLFDIYPLYDAALKKFGPNALNYRRNLLTMIPEADRESVKQYVTGDPPTIEILDDSLDARFGNIRGWYHDRHPNDKGYNVIGEETAKYLAPIIRQRAHQP
jgi:lysophospholipase L1-like esterase